MNLHSDCTLIEQNIIYHYFLLNRPNSNNQFAGQTEIISFSPQMFLLSSIMLGGLLYEHSNFHLSVNCLIRRASNDLQSNDYPLKLPNTYHYEIFWYDLFLTALLCATLAETVYYSWFGQKSSYLHIGVLVLRSLVLHLLDIHKLIFGYVHRCMYAKFSMWTF